MLNYQEYQHLIEYEELDEARRNVLQLLLLLLSIHNPRRLYLPPER